MRELLIFYKYSLFYQIGFNLCLIFGFFIITGSKFYESFSVLGISLWFLIFYLMPTWVAGTIIIPLRRLGISYILAEAIICILCFIGGLHLLALAQILTFGRSSIDSPNIPVVGLTWGLVIYFCGRFLESRHKLKHSKNLMLDAQREALIFQLNPHFLFNGLNTISAYIHSKPDLADKAVHNLADILRHSLDAKTKHSVTLREELDALEKYFAIEKFRFGECLSYEVQIDKRLLYTQVPPLLIQPAIENAVKHGIREGYYHISINSGLEGDRAWVTIKDTGSGFPDQILTQFNNKRIATHGFGLRLLSERVKFLKDSSIELSNENGACVKISWLLESEKSSLFKLPSALRLNTH